MYKFNINKIRTLIPFLTLESNSKVYLEESMCDNSLKDVKKFEKGLFLPDGKVHRKASIIK